MQLDGKRVIVTGGAQGIGEAAVRAFVHEGATVVSLDVQDDKGAAVVASADGSGRATYLHCDVGRRADVEAAFERATAELGGLDALVHVAGVERSSPAQDITDADWDLILDVNLKGTFLTNQAPFPHLRDNGGGRIVNFGSGAGLDKYPGGAHYSASKGGVMSWSRSVAAEWGPHGIGVVAIVPAMWTPMYDAHRAALSPDALAAHDAMMAGLIPMGGKLGDAETDLAPMLVFLLTDAARFITAQVIAVDGGLTPTR